MHPSSQRGASRLTAHLSPEDSSEHRLRQPSRSSPVLRPRSFSHLGLSPQRRGTATSAQLHAQCFAAGKARARAHEPAHACIHMCTSSSSVALAWRPATGGSLELAELPGVELRVPSRWYSGGRGSGGSNGAGQLHWTKLFLQGFQNDGGSTYTKRSPSRDGGRQATGGLGGGGGEEGGGWRDIFASRKRDRLELKTQFTKNRGQPSGRGEGGLGGLI